MADKPSVTPFTATGAVTPFTATGAVTPFTATGAVRLTVASPCSANWSEMTGDQQRRFCGKCHKHVYDLSAMRWEEVKALLDQRDLPCVRFYQREDGTVMTADCPVGREKKWRRIRLRAVLSGLAALVLAAVTYFRVNAPRRACSVPATFAPEEAARWARAVQNVPLPGALAPAPKAQNDEWIEERRARLPGGERTFSRTMGRIATIGIIRGVSTDPQKK